ncbi:MAG TPA: glycoside hydrolase family 57 [Lamprocystis sp. (in: g-proteobacteria)]|nr:glycoside hydrolase family 57 [Lamprocystis sp. (in: g-proteobacteria)]
MSSAIFHALGLHMHQPPGNLRQLLEANPWEAEQILRCYERPVRYATEYRDVAHLHVGFSGVLLEQLLDPQIVDLYRHLLDIPAMLDRYAQADNIELIGMGQYHPIFPLIPREDWPEQLAVGRATMQRAFGRGPRGFWPPEMAFTMEMIPGLVEAGFEYVVVDGVHVCPEDGISDVFRPYLACHEGVCITVVPRDRDVSSAQQSGLDPTWFQNEVRWRAGGSPRPHEPRLVTTWSDGENGKWFREPHEGSGFFGYFFAPYMEHFRYGEYPITPVSLSAYLEHHPAVTYAQVQTGAWHAGATADQDLAQWGGSERQRSAMTDVRELSARYWDLRARLPDARSDDGPAEPARAALDRARRLILEAETSCFLYWGESWLPHLYERTQPAALELDAAESALKAQARPVMPQAPAARRDLAEPVSDPTVSTDLPGAAPPAVVAVATAPPNPEPDPELPPTEIPAETPVEWPDQPLVELPTDQPVELPVEAPVELPSAVPAEFVAASAGLAPAAAAQADAFNQARYQAESGPTPAQQVKPHSNATPDLTLAGAHPRGSGPAPRPRGSKPGR